MPIWNRAKRVAPAQSRRLTTEPLEPRMVLAASKKDWCRFLGGASASRTEYDVERDLQQNTYGEIAVKPV